MLRELQHRRPHGCSQLDARTGPLRRAVHLGSSSSDQDVRRHLRRRRGQRTPDGAFTRQHDGGTHRC
ncbi:hypothetical protein HBB16_14570 [Pseudonocardia sp. MCCB 268]|nr:hypothetical protein [Pseudonocardia cytotoxica]